MTISGLISTRTGLYACIAIALVLAPSAQAQSPSQSATPHFFTRWKDFYGQDWHPDPDATAAPSAPRRGVPPPIDAPPFPFMDWPYGGSPVIGEADTNSYPLMTAINGAKSRIKIYGWLDPTINFSTSSNSNAPVGNNLFSNSFQLNQAVLYIERLPDSVQRDHIDWGFHLTALYGTDYRYTTNKGYFSSQLLQNNRQYGFDPSLEYADIYFPHVAQGMNLRIGRYISIPGIEAQLSPNNYVFSHSLLYVIDPFTDTGVLATIKLSDQWLVQLGITASHDVAPWTSDAQPSGTACVSYTTRSVNNNFYLCANGINDGKYAFDNLQQYDATWYHKFSKTLHMATEAWYMYQLDVPAVGGPVAPQPGNNGAYCHPGQVRCTAPEYAFVNYINKQLTAHDYLTFRSDFLNDKKGQRTGYQTRYSENTLAWNHWIGSTIQIRPELRFDHAWDFPGYDNGTRRNQFTASSDLIVHF